MRLRLLFGDLLINYHAGLVGFSDHYYYLCGGRLCVVCFDFCGVTQFTVLCFLAVIIFLLFHRTRDRKLNACHGFFILRFSGGVFCRA